MTAPAPRVRLPSQAALNPNLAILIGIAERAMAEFGPAEASRLCAMLSSELRRAATHESVAGAIVGQFVVSGDCLEAASNWFLEAALACHRCQQ